MYKESDFLNMIESMCTQNAINLSCIDLKCNGKKVVTLFEILRNSREFIDKTDLISTKQKV